MSLVAFAAVNVHQHPLALDKHCVGVLRPVIPSGALPPSHFPRLSHRLSDRLSGLRTGPLCHLASKFTGDSFYFLIRRLPKLREIVDRHGQANPFLGYRRRTILTHAHTQWDPHTDIRRLLLFSSLHSHHPPLSPLPGVPHDTQPSLISGALLGYSLISKPRSHPIYRLNGSSITPLFTPQRCIHMRLCLNNPSHLTYIFYP